MPTSQLKPSDWALLSDIQRTAAAPSEICDEVPAVWMPSSSTGFSRWSPSLVVSRRPWSRRTVVRSSVGFPSSPTTGASMGTTSASNLPSAHARAAFCCDRSPRPSMSSRVMPRLFAIRSAARNWLGESQGHSGGRGEPGPLTPLAPSGTRLIASTPQAMPMSIAPAMTRLATKLLACWPEPHWQSTVVAATS